MSLKRSLVAEFLEKRQLLAANCVALNSAANESLAMDSANRAEIALQRSDSGTAEGEQFGIDNFREHLSILRDEFDFPLLHGLHHPATNGPDLIQEHDGRLFVIDRGVYSRGDDRLVVLETDQDGTFAELINIPVDLRVERMFVTEDRVVLFANEQLFHTTERFHRWDPGDHQTETAIDGSGLIDSILPWRGHTIALTIDLATAIEDGEQQPAEDDSPATDPSAEEPADATSSDTNSDVDGDAEIIERGIVRQEFDGPLIDVIGDDGRLILTTHHTGPVIAIYPPPPPAMNVRMLEVTADGLVELDAALPELGQSVYSAGTMLTGMTEYPSFFHIDPETGFEENDILLPDVSHRAVITQFTVSDSSIDEITRLDLGDGHLIDLHLSDDASTAIAVRSLYTGNRQEMLIDLLDLSQTEIRVFETITVEDASGYALSIDTDHVLIVNHLSEDSLILIETNQNIDVAAEGRVRRIESPAGVRIDSEAVRVSDGQLLFLGRITPPRTVDGDDDMSSSIDGSRRSRRPVAALETVLVTVSISDATARISGVWKEPGGEPSPVAVANRIFVIDAPTDRVGFLTHRFDPTEGEENAPFEYGRLDDEGDFVREGSIEHSHGWLEIDVDDQRLIARETGRVLEYRWDDIENPIVHPFHEDDRDPIVAFDDFFTLERDEGDHLLDVLANDTFGEDDLYWYHRVFNARDNDEDRERLDPSIDEALDATVRIVELIDAPDGVQVDGDQILVPAGVVDQFDQFSFQYVISDGHSESVATVEVVVREDVRETVAEVSLRVVDDAGDPTRQIAVGDIFWIELVGQDLRRDGGGVYAAFVDLELPVELVQLTGPIEYGEGFTSINVGSFTEHELMDFGAIGSEVDPPGNDRPQSLVRIQATALSAGAFVMTPTPSETPGTETLVHGRDSVVPNSRVRFAQTDVIIAEAPDLEPDLDANGDGVVTAADALKVINFLTVHGAMSLDDSAAEGEQGAVEVTDSMRRNDTNHDGQITPLDALMVVNGLQRLVISRVDPSTTDSQPESTTVSAVFAASTFTDDDDDDDQRLMMTNA